MVSDKSIFLCPKLNSTHTHTHAHAHWRMKEKKIFTRMGRIFSNQSKQFYCYRFEENNNNKEGHFQDKRIIIIALSIANNNNFNDILDIFLVESKFLTVLDN